MTPEQEIDRGDRASRIMEDPVFKDSMEKIKAQILEQWAATGAKKTEDREWLWNHYQAVLKFEEILTTVMNTGKMAALKKQESIREKASRIWGVR